MQYLMVLLVMTGIFVAMAAAIAGMSYALGLAMHSRAALGGAIGTDACAQCEADREWYEGLPAWQRSLALAWWLANRYTCAAKGCR
jgi:hypothetical protein